jgi:hypothetical protein
VSGAGLRERVAALTGRARADRAELVAIRSVARPRGLPPEECSWAMEKFAQVGFTRLSLRKTGDGSRAVYGVRPGAGPDAPTVLLHADYDNIVMHLTALRALGPEALPVRVKLIVEGSEDFVERHSHLLRADAILVGDTDNPLCDVFAETYPDAEIHAPDESLAPSEVALAEALFLQRYRICCADDEG